MRISYVQYMNIGFGIINNTKKVDSWDTDACIEEALLLDNLERDIRIIGFRFYDIDSETNNVLKQSGINYLSGEILIYPKVDNEVLVTLHNTGQVYNKGDKLIKIMKPYALVYPFRDEDCILNIEPYLAAVKARKVREEIETTKNAIEIYKAELISSLRLVIEAIENNAYNRVPIVESTHNSEEKVLNIMNDHGIFGKHIDYLRNERLRIISLGQSINETIRD